jgi:predicted MPP superfamily phosphohydrolase
MIRRVLTAGALWTSTWWLIIGALLAPVIPGGWITVLAAILLATAPLLVLVQRFNGVYPSKFTRWWVFRPFWYLQLASLLMAWAGVAGFLAGAPFGAASVTGRTAIVVVAIIFVIAAATGYIGSRQLRVKQLEAWFPDLPAALEGLRIVQVSDLHVGPHTSPRYLAKVARAVENARPDLIAITGDQVDDYPGDVAYFAEAFRGLSAPLGVFAVAGNHDIYAGWRDVHAGLEAMGVTVLVNDAVEIVRGTSRFWLAGTGDPAGAGSPLGGRSDVAPDVARTLARVPQRAFTVVLAHNPALWPQLAGRGVHLTLSGHTHYGQLSIPHMDWSLASLFLEHAMDWHRRGGSLLYINPGTNYWGLPLRIGALQEVTVLTLLRAEGGDAEIRLPPPDQR